MGRHASVALRMAVATIVVFGVLYPLAMTGIAQLAFPRQANGSLISEHGRVVGSELIGQQFVRPEYFHPRPSAAGDGCDAAASGGSNLGPTSRKLANDVKSRVETARRTNPGLGHDEIPADMVTASASGLDPDISPANAYAQVARVAEARGIRESRVRRLVRANTTGREFDILGEPRVNVLRLNIALDAAAANGWK